jgi:hypothetical protein
MPEFYFNKFPVISYANSNCIDITKRVTIDVTLRNSPMLYTNYTLKAESRADVIASNYYEDPYYEWLLYLTNGVIDPYYDWHLGTTDFNEFIIDKYGSIEAAMKTIKYYQNNWVNDDTEITPTFFNNTLSKSLRKYYTPNYGMNNQIISYGRKKDDTTINTNKLINMGITVSSGNGFIADETVDILYINTVVGAGQIEFANSSIVKLKKISGNTAATNTIRGDVSNTIATINSSTISFENITNDEAVFWSPVYCYDYEQELNEKNKNIKLLDSNYALQTAEELRTKLKQ